MDVNANADFKGALNESVISNIAASTDPGAFQDHTKGTFKFSNGVKIQWDTVDIDANTTASFSLPEAYTLDHWTVIGCFADVVGDSATDTSLQFFVPTTNKLSQVRITNAAEITVPVTYLSIGRDWT